MAKVNSTVTATADFPLQCSDDSSLQSLPSPVLLGPLDQRSLLAIPLAVVFVYRAKASTEELIPIDRLRRAICRLLDYYPHLTGRIIINPEDQSPQIEQLGAGAKLVTAQCTEPLKSFEVVSGDDKPGSTSRLIGTNLPDGGNALLPPFDPTEAGAACDSILTVQHTRFACGGVSIGLRLRHIICDAAGFFQLARDLAELYRAFRSHDLDQSSDAVKLSSPPVINSFLAGVQKVSDEHADILQSSPTLFELAPEIQAVKTNETGPSTPPPPVIGRILRFSFNELAAIKAEANADSSHNVSTFCALTAHLWQNICRARVRLCESQGMSSVEAASKVPRQFLASLDLRGRGQVDISPRYFPNLVLCPVFSLPAEDLLTAPISRIAVAVREGVQPLDPVEVQQNIQWLAAQTDKERVRLRYRYEEGGIMVSQWNKFGMYQGTALDVPPTLVVQPFTPISLIDGLIYFMATEDQLKQSEHSTGVTTGSIDVSLALSEPVWNILDDTPQFRQYRQW
ncbi:hypothetical protein PHMEG_00010193 [Phytophthora megakarya]|uniref:Transferase n=1 Tax=Phytophthora megakarya TaxID=4795 RepID=A0A225WGC5_9STRA|nr:hypothetical protein PHMEG_00010193 [Phytophthora megakarya]